MWGEKMASKSKRALKKKEPVSFVIFISVVTSILALLQNKYGQFSDIRGFYGMHFSDGQHHWPFSTHTLLGATESIHPVEYPALTGLIMWLFSFTVEPAQFAWVDYFRITASFHVVLFAITAFYIKQLAGKKWAIVFALSPAVLYSLNRNWDIWAVVAMIWAIYLFEKGKMRQSAIVLAVSVATKLFPIVLLFPIFFYFIRQKKLRAFIEYFGITIGAWLLINLPFMIINFRGWSYFYEFSYKRGLGSASIFDVTGQVGFGLPTWSWLFYLLNLVLFGGLGLYFWKSGRIVPLAEGAFLTMFAFILFNKQYSMQYVIWLASLAVIALAHLSKKRQLGMLYIYAVWQASELAFQYSFFQNILTNINANTATPASPAISGYTYGMVGVIRYTLAVLFTVLLAKYLFDDKKADSPGK
jgi:uncharacterized membrane protein